MWGLTHPTVLDPLYKLQMKVVRIITFNNKYTHTTPLFYDLHQPAFRRRLICAQTSKQLRVKLKTTQFGINMQQCSRQAYFKFHLYKQSSHITIFSLCSLNLTSCTVIMCFTDVFGHLVMSFITIKSLHIDLLIHMFGTGIQMFCGHNWFIVLIRWWAEFFSVAT